jgi:Hsp20/alpha crystallin family
MQTALTHRSATDLERRDPFGFWTLHWPECLWTFPSVSSMAGDGMLHIQAERRQEEELEDKDMHRSELRDGVFTRTLPLPAGVGEQDVDASYKAGILEIRIPVDQKKAAIKVPVRAS